MRGSRRRTRLGVLGSDVVRLDFFRLDHVESQDRPLFGDSVNAMSLSANVGTNL